MTFKLNLLKLRLNPNEDFQILDTIDFFINFYLSKYKTSQELIVAHEKCNSLINYTQQMLKKEWEKVKIESKGKRKIHKRVNT